MPSVLGRLREEGRAPDDKGNLPVVCCKVPISASHPPPVGFLLEGGTKDRSVQREKMPIE